MTIFTARRRDELIFLEISMHGKSIRGGGENRFARHILVRRNAKKESTILFLSHLIAEHAHVNKHLIEFTLFTSRSILLTLVCSHMDEEIFLLLENLFDSRQWQDFLVDVAGDFLHNI